jgi:hypothetical protein
MTRPLRRLQELAVKRVDGSRVKTHLLHRKRRRSRKPRTVSERHTYRDRTQAASASDFPARALICPAT